MFFSVCNDLFINRTTPDRYSDLNGAHQHQVNTRTKARRKRTNPSDDIQSSFQQHVPSWRAPPRRRSEYACVQIRRDMELAILDAFKETLRSLLCSQSFIRRLDFTCDGGLGLVLLIETGCVHRRREEDVSSNTIKETLRAKAFGQGCTPGNAQRPSSKLGKQESIPRRACLAGEYEE